MTFALCLLFLVSGSIVHGQILNRVHMVDHREYMSAVLGETMRRMEERGWSSLKLNDFSNEYNETVLHWHLGGTVTYKHGFVTSIQQIDILRSSVNQHWANVGDGTVTVEVRGQLRMTDLSIGYDVEVDVAEGARHYTAVIRYPMTTFDFSVFRNVHTNAMWVTARSNLLSTNVPVRFMPTDTITDALITLFQWNSLLPGVTAWSTDHFQPLADYVVKNVVEFPGLCYDCPAT